jgi:thermostable 8-oxoguanine DNA glycosylase
MNDTDKRQTQLDGSIVPSTPREWWRQNKAEYEDAWRQVREARKVLLDGPKWAAAMNLKRCYVFGVMSQQTKTELAEEGFVEYVEGVPLRRAFASCVYPNQHADWIEHGLENHDFEELVHAVRLADSISDTAGAIDAMTNLKGLSYRKAAFTLAMAGLHECMCIDRNVSYAIPDVKPDTEDWSNAEGYVEACGEVHDAAELPELEPFEAQWTIFDYARDTVSTHEKVYDRLILDPR